MNPDTGGIARFETWADAKRAGHTIKLTEQQAAKFMGMNRKQRRAEAAKLRHAKRAR